MLVSTVTPIINGAGRPSRVDVSRAARAAASIIAGADAVQVGTANFVDPFVWKKLLDGITDYMRRHNISRVADLVGTIDTTSREKEWISS